MIDSGASAHMSSNATLFNKRNIVRHKQAVVLRDGNLKYVQYVRDI